MRDSSRGSTSNSSQARPGTFISASSTSRRSGSQLSTRQKSRASPGTHVVRVAAATPHADTARQQVEGAPRGARARWRSTSLRRRRCAGSGRTRQTASTAPRCRAGRRRVATADGVRPAGARLCRRTGRRTSGWRPPGCRPRQSPGRWRRAAAGARRGKADRRRRVADDGGVAEAPDQLASDAGVERRDEAEPQARQVRGQQRDGDHQAPQAALPRVLPHDVAVGDHVGSADLEDRDARRRRASSPPPPGTPRHRRWRWAGP